MIQWITPQMRILVAIEAVDGRKGIDSLAQLCQEKLQSDPLSGSLLNVRAYSFNRPRAASTTSQNAMTGCCRPCSRFQAWSC